MSAYRENGVSAVTGIGLSSHSPAPHQVPQRGSGITDDASMCVKVV